MLIITSIEHAEKLVKDGVLKVEGDLKIEVENFIINASIVAWDISAEDINAWDISARNINAEDIRAGDISAEDINAWVISARNINARNINAEDINANRIYYYASCIAYKSLVCESIEGRRKNSIHTCLDSEIVYRGKKDSKCTCCPVHGNQA